MQPTKKNTNHFLKAYYICSFSKKKNKKNPQKQLFRNKKQDTLHFKKIVVVPAPLSYFLSSSTFTFSSFQLYCVETHFDCDCRWG